jgi:hypothetical protein
MDRYLFVSGLIAFIGLFVRLYHIHFNQFLFYDEGMYLGYNRAFLNLVANNPPHTLQELGIILSLMLKTALTTPKTLWFFILNLRVFFVGPEAWYFARLVSVVSGLATVVLLFFWSKRYFKSERLGYLSALILLILPSHVFYSRLGMQEALSTLLFLGAIYMYMLRDRIQWPFFVSALLLVCVYLTNYRMIIAPIFIAFIEAFSAVAVKNKRGQFKLSLINWQKIAVFFASFYGLALLIGCLYGGANLQITTAWMFHQAEDAGGKFNPINFLSYPFYVFALEGIFFACFFWGNVYLIKLKEYQKLLPFGLVVLQMAMFSFAAEKGARYLCVVLPFMAAAAAVVLNEAWVKFVKFRSWIVGLSSLALVGMVYLSTCLALASTDYENAVHFITDHDPQAVIVSTQPLVEGLFMADERRIVACPKDLASLAELYKNGARYLIMDPQAYISWTADGRRFSPPLIDFLEAVFKGVPPLGTFPHLNQILLGRLVLDHNEQILDSVSFLSKAQSQEYGKIRVYDLGSVFTALKSAHAQGVL